MSGFGNISLVELSKMYQRRTILDSLPVRFMFSSIASAFSA